MMNDGLLKLLDSLASVNAFSLDTTLKEENPDPGQRTLPISEDDFFAYLYESRQAEKLLKRKINSAEHNLLCLVGPKGSGKTTLGRKIIRDFSLTTNMFVAYVDIRLLRSARHPAEADGDAPSMVFSHLRDYYFSTLFPPRQKLPNRIIDSFWLFLLSPEHEVNRPRELFLQFQDFEAEAISYYESWVRAKPAERKSATLCDWLTATRNDQIIRDLLLRIRSKVSFPHLLHASRHVYNLKRHLIWVDNIDGLLDNEQSAVVHSLGDLNRLVADYAASVVALRESNVFRESDLEDGAPPLNTRILLEAPRAAGGQVVYPSVDVPVIASELLRSIVEKRILFANQDWPLRKPILNDKQLSDLLSISRKLTAIFERDRAIYLANNSVRDLLRIHRDCLRFLLQYSGSEKSIEAVRSYDDWYIATLFFLWVSCTQRQYGWVSYDLVALKEQWRSSGESRPGCFLPHVLMTCIWNFAIERKARGLRIALPSVKEVQDRVALLGFSLEEIREEILLLHRDHFGQRFNFVEIRTPKVLVSAADLQDDHKLYLTYRAKAVLAFTSSSFGYFYGCVKRLGQSEDEMISSHHEIDLVRFFEEEGCRHLEEIVDMHLAALGRIRDSGSFGKESWLRTYRSWFGVPLVGPYPRKLGVPGSALSLELIFSSLTAHCHARRLDVPELLRIDAKFRRGLNELT